jgi:hypothetical protein
VNDIFQEVEDDYRHEQYRAMLKRYGPYAIAAAVGFVLLVGGHEAYKSYRANLIEREAQDFVGAATQLTKDPKAAAQAFATLAGKGGGYGFLARFRQAEALEASGDTGAAVKVLDGLAGERSRDPEMADLALLKTGYLLLDKQSRADLETRLAPLLTDGNPWHAQAREIIAFAALKSGEEAKAVQIFTELAHDAASAESLRTRAADMLTALGGPNAAARAPSGAKSQ